MPFQMKVQPVDARGLVRSDPVKPAGGKSRLKRLFERQFQSVLRISSVDKIAGAGDGKEKERDDGIDTAGDFEPSSVCLDKMVMSFIEDGSSNYEKPSRSRCNCFNGNYDESSDDEFDFEAGDAPVTGASSGDAADVIKGLVLCGSVAERNLLADASKIVENTKSSKEKDDRLKVVADGLRSLGYDASVCKSRWDKSPAFPAGEYDYIDVIIDGGERLLVDVDFKSEFEIARSTKSYRSVLQQLPAVFVGEKDRLQQIVSVVSEAARQSLKKKGLHIPPWRKSEYMRAKWLSPYQRTTAMGAAKEESVSGGVESVACGCDGNASFSSISIAKFSGDVEVRNKDSSSGVEEETIVPDAAAAEETVALVVSPWRPPPAKPKSGAKVVTGLASVL